MIPAVTWACALAAVLVASLGGASIAFKGWPHSTVWQEVAWPFPRDAWPAGRAFHCDGAACGGSQDVYVRVKTGFCNCTTGVSGDAEVDGVSDLDMISDRFEPRGEGESIVAGGLPGRVRAYDLTLPDGRTRPAAGFALSAKCDLVAVAAIGDAAGTQPARRGVAVLLGSDDVARWLRSRLGRG